jgi:Excalibur calcium-binding domain
MWQTKPTPWKLDKRGYDPDDRADELRRRFERVSRKSIRGRKGRNLEPWIAGGALICIVAVVIHGVARANDWTYEQSIRHILAAPNCNAARMVGLAPAMRDQPGYYLKHDRDRDGVACEPYPRDNSPRRG